jgi:predicted nucleotidyltransferase
MKNNLLIFKQFVDNKNKTFSIKKVSEAVKINYRIVYEEILELEGEGLIKITRHGNSNVCEFSYKYCSKAVEIEEARRQEVFKNKDIELIDKRIKEVKSPFYILVLFGSYATRANQRGSDIDLCLITDDPAINKGVNAILSVTPLNVHLLEFTSEQFLQMIKSKESNVGNEIVKNNIILWGQEGFYSLVNNVKDMEVINKFKAKSTFTQEDVLRLGKELNANLAKIRKD